MAVATARTPGFTLCEGRVACVCLATWLPAFERLAVRRGFVRHSIDIVQLTGTASASAGVHEQGGAWDIAQTSVGLAMLAREMGSAAWVRTAAYGWHGGWHTHGVLVGCPHNGPARYQVLALRARRNGLGWMGLAGPDPHPAPSAWRTWTEGLAWAQQQLAPHPTTPPASSSLTLGSKGDRVKALQRGLNRAFPAYSRLVVDGVFGPRTQAVVREYQRRSGLVVDGIVGPQTLGCLARDGIKI